MTIISEMSSTIQLIHGGEWTSTDLSISTMNVFLTCFGSAIKEIEKKSILILWTITMCIRSILGDCFKARMNYKNTEFTDVTSEMLRMAHVIDNYIQIPIQLYGHEQWLTVNDSEWFNAFSRARMQTSEDGEFLSTQEYHDLTMILPNGANTTQTKDFLHYYNRTIAVWTYNLTNVTLSYLHKEQFLNNIKQVSDDMKSVQTNGYDNILEAFYDTAKRYQNAVKQNEKQQSVCAAVKIQIPQKIAITRQGFDAKLEIGNAGDTAITQLKADIIIKDNDRPQDITHYFSIGQPTFTGSLNDIKGNGMIASRSSGSVNWLIIPYSIAAPSTATYY